MHRATFRYVAHARADAGMRGQLQALATHYPRAGDRRIQGVLKRTQRLRVRRLWRRQRHQVRPQCGPGSARRPIQA